MAARPTATEVEALSERNRGAWLKKALKTGLGSNPASPRTAPRPRTQSTPLESTRRGIRKRGIDYEETLAHALMSNTFGLSRFERQYLFAPGRKYRADFFFPDHNLIVEIDGAVHRIKARFKADIERDQVIFFLGYRKLRISTAQVRSGEAVQLIERALR